MGFQSFDTQLPPSQEWPPLEEINIYVPATHHCELYKWANQSSCLLSKLRAVMAGEGSRGRDCLSFVETGNEAWGADGETLCHTSAGPLPLPPPSMSLAGNQALSLLMSRPCLPWGLSLFGFLAADFPFPELGCCEIWCSGRQRLARLLS